MAVLFLGAIIARLSPDGMARMSFAAVLVQALVPVIAFYIWPPSVISWAPGVFAVFVLNGFFVMLFVGSALLFRLAGETSRESVLQ